MLRLPQLDDRAYYRDEFPELVASRRSLLDGVSPPPTLTFVVDGRPWTYEMREGAVWVTATGGGATVVALDAGAWSDLMGQIRSVPALMLAGALEFRAGTFDHLAAWEPILRAVHAGIPIYDAQRADLADREGRPLDLTRAFTLDDSLEDLAWHFERVGFARVRNVFTSDEIAAFNAEVDRLAAAARPGDGRSWWVTTRAGDEVLCRLVYASLGSDTFAGLEDDPRLRRLLSTTGHELACYPDRMEGHSILLKVPGEVRGLANIPWHQDCGLGGHPLMCPSVAIGIQLTGADADRGRFEAIAGSHGQTCPYRLDGDLAGLPVVGIDTEPGDVTIHTADVMHASPPPAGPGGRRTLYVTYYPPHIADHVGPGEAINDLIRDRGDAAHDLL